MSSRVMLSFPKSSEYIRVARMTAASMASLMGFHVEDVEDIKVLISEMCIYFMNHVEKHEMHIKVIFDNKTHLLEMTVEDLNGGSLQSQDHDMTKMIIESLADSFYFAQDSHQITVVKRVSE